MGQKSNVFAGDRDCTTCNGNGSMWRPCGCGGGDRNRGCAICHGAGQADQRCGTCGGTGLR